MTFLLVILTLIVAVIFELMRRSRKKHASKNHELVTEYPTVFDAFDRYFHPGHTWVLISDQRSMKVGVDDFSVRIIGQVGKIELPEIGQIVRQGDSLAVLQHGSRRLAQVAPISGRIVDVNRKLRRRPELVNASPLERGWLAKILPTNLEADLRNLLKGFAADGWRDSVRAQLIRLFSPSFGTVIQDGGQIVEDFGVHLSDEEWNRIVQQFFTTLLSNQEHHNLKN